MRIVILSACALLLIAVPMVSAQEGKGHDSGPWVADFDKAVGIAKKENKDLLVDFTGSDWCHWCIKLHEEVFAKKEFLDTATKQFVLVALDFPNSAEAKAKVPNPDRNKELSKKYGVRGYPTVLLMTSDGEVFGRTGYEPGGPTNYISSLENFRGDKERLPKINALVKAYDAAEGEAQSKLFEQAIALMGEMKPGAAGLDALGGVVRQGLASSDAALQEKTLRALLAAGEMDEQVMKLVGELATEKNEKGFYEYVVFGKMGKVRSEASARDFISSFDALLEVGIKDRALAEQMLFNATRWSFGPLKDPEAAKKYGKHLQEKAKDASQYKDLLKEVLGQEDKKGEEAKKAKEAAKASPQPEGAVSTVASGMEGVPDIKILKVHKTGSGPKCGTGKSASLRYKAMLGDGTVVDPGSRPFTFQVGARRAIVGWDRVVAEMRVGDSWTVHIPYQLCYGERGRSGIPPKADMRFDMELLSFQ